MLDDLLEPAFLNPVAATQKAFRVALKALSEPGMIQLLTHAPALETLAPASYALCLTLVDNDTPVWLAPVFDTPGVRANLAFHCACPVVRRREEAAFALLTPAELEDLSAFNAGSDRYPDQSCTLLIQMPGLEEGARSIWHGPGIQHERISHLPVGAEFWRQRSLCNAFPKGLDMFFCSEQALIGLPRSTRVSSAIQGGL